MNGNMTILEWITQIAQITFYATPLLIALVTLGLAWWRFKIFRVREPAITTDLRVSSRQSSPSYNALSRGSRTDQYVQSGGKNC